MSTIIVTGGATGLGAALVAELTASNHQVFPYDIKGGHDVRNPVNAVPANLDILINCAGINKTGWLADFPEQTWDDVMDVNAKGIFKMTQWALPSLIKSKGTVLNIVSNASHMPMTCSVAYNASKGAAHIMTLQMARELTKKYGITVFGISPNKLAGTGMSKDIEVQVLRDRGWSAEQANAYQLAALLTGEETDPRELARFVAYLLSSKQRHKYFTGCIIPYGA